MPESRVQEKTQIKKKNTDYEYEFVQLATPLSLLHNSKFENVITKTYPPPSSSNILEGLISDASEIRIELLIFEVRGEGGIRELNGNGKHTIKNLKNI